MIAIGVFYDNLFLTDDWLGQYRQVSCVSEWLDDVWSGLANYRGSPQDSLPQGWRPEWLLPDPDADTTSPQAVYDAARRYVAGGLSVIPISTDGDKTPDSSRLFYLRDARVSWKRFQDQRPTEPELQRWRDSGGAFGLAVVGGPVSGGAEGCGLEIIDFDSMELAQPWMERVEGRAPGLIARLVRVQSPRPGMHVYYRCSEFGGSQKLACGPENDADGDLIIDEHGRVKKKGLIELKGEGGYCVVPPSPRRCHPRNQLYRLVDGSPDLTQVPEITPEERAILLEEARSFNQWSEPDRERPLQARQKVQGDGGRPGDDFNERANWSDILEPHGWECVGGRGDEEYWCRPGKSCSISATVNYADSGLLYVFSSNAHPFDDNRAYSKFAAYALLEFGGDFYSAAAQLKQEGYGARSASAAAIDPLSGNVASGVVDTLSPVGDEPGVQVICNPMPSPGRMALHLMARRDRKLVHESLVFEDRQDSIDEFCRQVSQKANVGLQAVERQVTEHLLRLRRQKAMGGAADGGGFQGQLLTSDELSTYPVKREWLIKKVLVADQPGVMGGPKKSMKTSVLIDAAISLGSGRPFLGHFDVPRRTRVLVLSGESGMGTIKETALRVAWAKGVNLNRAGECDVYWGFDLPRLAVQGDLQMLAAVLRNEEIGVVFIDPIYLCLQTPGQELQANNMFQVGPLLMRVAKVCQDAGATLVLIHHTRKFSNKFSSGQEFEPLDLEDLAYAGFQEFARQWVLVNRRQKYEPGTGKHDLWLNVGGSAGHSGCWGLDVDEGQLNDRFGGRQWDVRVRSMQEARTATRMVKAESRKERKEGEKRVQQTEDVVKVTLVLKRYPNGESKKKIAEEAGVPYERVGRVLDILLQQGTVMETKVKKGAGRGKQSYPGWRLSRDEEQKAAMDRLREQVAQERLGRGAEAQEPGIGPAEPAEDGEEG